MIALPEIPRPEPQFEPKLRARLDALAKPPGSLGKLEDIAVRLGLLQGCLEPSAQRALLTVFAGDHGLTKAGVSPYPAAITVSMVRTFLSGRGSANALATTVNATIKVIDAGLAVELPDHPHFVKANVRRGTRNALSEAAMTEADVDKALARGIALSADAAAQGFDMLALGEMGIGNSSSAALIMHRLTGIPLSRCVGRGAGHDDAGLARKLSVLERTAGRTGASAPRQVLAEFGGCEIAMMSGAAIGAAAARRIILVDGFVSTVAVLAAARLDPAVLDYCFFCHRSAEAGHTPLLEALGVEPLLDLRMRLGEGTGALLAIPLVRASAALLSDVATLDEMLKAAR